MTFHHHWLEFGGAFLIAIAIMIACSFIEDWWLSRKP